MRFSTQRRRFLSRFAVMASALLTLLAATHATGRASGTPEIFACGNTYKVDLTALAGTPCIPLSVHTSWGSGPVIYPAFPQYTTPGVFIESPGVPLGTPLNSIEVCGKIVPPVAGQYTIGCPGCTLCVRVCFPSGCLVIKIYPGPCPGPLLPCP